MRIIRIVGWVGAVVGMLLLGGCGSFFVSSTTLVSLALTPANPTLLAGKTQQFTATGSFGDGSSKDVTSQVTWTSSSTGVATITSAGLASTVANGTTTITAKSDSSLGSSTMTANTTLTVSSVVVTSLAITPGNSTVRVGQTQQMTATATNSDGTTKDVSNTATWQSSNAGVASVSSTGLVTGLTAGSTTLTATLGTNSATTSLSVTAF